MCCPQYSPKAQPSPTAGGSYGQWLQLLWLKAELQRLHGGDRYRVVQSSPSPKAGCCGYRSKRLLGKQFRQPLCEPIFSRDKLLPFNISKLAKSSLHKEREPTGVLALAVGSRSTLQN